MRSKGLLYATLSLLPAIGQCFVPCSLTSSAVAVPKTPLSSLRAWNNDKDEATIEEEARLRIYESRRSQIRSALKSAEGIRNFRIKNGMNDASFYSTTSVCEMFSSS